MATSDCVQIQVPCGYRFGRPSPPIGAVSTRLPNPASIGLPFANAACTAGIDSDAWWLAWLSQTSVIHSASASAVLGQHGGERGDSQ
jgi:hypothetical protein